VVAVLRGAMNAAADVAATALVGFAAVLDFV
jgi:hypothetical protein